MTFHLVQTNCIEERIALLVHLLCNLHTIPGYNVSVETLKASTTRTDNQTGGFAATIRSGPSPTEVAKLLEEIYAIRATYESYLRKEIG